MYPITCLSNLPHKLHCFPLFYRFLAQCAWVSIVNYGQILWEWKQKITSCKHLTCPWSESQCTAKSLLWGSCTLLSWCQCPASSVDKAPIESAKPKACSQKLHVPSSVATRQNPPHSQSTSAALSSMPQNSLGVPAPTIANSTAVTETCPLCKTALATRALFQQVQLSMNNDIKEESTESDDDSSEDLGNDNPADWSCSDVETSNVILEWTIHGTDPNQKPVSTSTSCTSGKTPQLSPSGWQFYGWKQQKQWQW